MMPRRRASGQAQVTASRLRLPVLPQSAAFVDLLLELLDMVEQAHDHLHGIQAQSQVPLDAPDAAQAAQVVL
jgi:hypothetical protein